MYGAYSAGALGFVGATSHAAGPGRAAYTEIASGEQLVRGTKYYSPNKSVFLVFQGDGNLVIYNAAGKAIWNTNTQGHGATQAVLQTDGNLVVYAGTKALWNSQSHGNPGSRLWVQDDGNVVVYNKANRPVYVSHTTGGTPPNSGNVFSDVVGTITDIITAPVTAIAKVTESIPVLGDVTGIVSDAASAPGNIAKAVASGARLDHVAVNALKAQLKLVKDVAPYAQTVVSLVPGIGSGVAAAVGAGVALAEGQSITEAVKAGIRGAIPGGPLVQAGYDMALKVAAGENVGKAALEGVRAQLSPAAQKAFDVGLAVVTGEKIQTALANGLASLAPAQLQTIVAAGQKAIGTMPGLSSALKSVAPGAATEGFKIAAGLLSQSGINEKALSAARNGLSAEVRQGFDAALKTQEPHTAWVKNVTNPPAIHALEPPKRSAAAPVTSLTPPKRPAPAAPAHALEPPKKKTPTMYGPYPQGGALSGVGWGLGGEDAWGPAIVDMPQHMEWAGRSAVHGSHGRSRKVQGPDGTTYLFSIENGTLTARPSLVV